MDINHIDHHDHHHNHTPTTNYKLPTTSNWHEEVKFSMAMDDHHHHHHHHQHQQHHDHDHHLVSEQHQHHLHPIIPLFDQQAWPNYLHNHINNHTSSSSSTFSSLKKPLKITTRETELEEEDREEGEEEEEEEEELGAMKEMMYRYAVMQPVDIDPATIRKPKRRNVRISNDPQSVAARHRRERISEKVRILQRLVPGGTKMDTASMLDEAIRYVKFLKKQIRQLQQQPSSNHHHHPPSVPSAPPSAWPLLPTSSLVGSTSVEDSNDPREAKVVLMREHFHHTGTIFHDGGN